MGHTLVFTVVLDVYFWHRSSAECQEHNTEQNSSVVKMREDPEINQITSMFKRQGRNMFMEKINLRERR